MVEDYVLSAALDTSCILWKAFDQTSRELVKKIMVTFSKSIHVCFKIAEDERMLNALILLSSFLPPASIPVFRCVMVTGGKNICTFCLHWFDCWTASIISVHYNAIIAWLHIGIRASTFLLLKQNLISFVLFSKSVIPKLRSLPDGAPSSYCKMLIECVCCWDWTTRVLELLDEWICEGVTVFNKNKCDIKDSGKLKVWHLCNQFVVSIML